MCVNNLSKVALDSASAGIERAISSRKSNTLTTTPPSHTKLVLLQRMIDWLIDWQLENVDAILANIEVGRFIRFVEIHRTAHTQRRNNEPATEAVARPVFALSCVTRHTHLNVHYYELHAV